MGDTFYLNLLFVSVEDKTEGMMPDIGSHRQLLDTDTRSRWFWFRHHLEICVARQMRQEPVCIEVVVRSTRSWQRTDSVHSCVFGHIREVDVALQSAMDG